MKTKPMNVAEMMSVETVRETLLAQLGQPLSIEMCALEQAQGRVLAQDLVSGIQVPGFDNSAMDGYALNWQEGDGIVWPVVQRIAAGEVGSPLARGQAARIFTGAPIPQGCTVVVPQEQVVQQQDESIKLTASVRSGQHIRRAGEDIEAGQCILNAGTHLQARHLGFVASVGIAQVPVYRRLRIGVFFTGDELVEPGVSLRPGTIYNSNRYALGALLRNLGASVQDYGVVSDDVQALTAVLQQASEDCDVLITSGGVSVGEEDHVKTVVAQLGRIDLWKVAMKPGKPFVFGQIGQANFIGLPGNPVSAFVTFVLLARPFLKAKQGYTDVMPLSLRIPAAFEWSRLGRQREFVRVAAQIDEQGHLQAVLSSQNQGSGVTTSVAQADGLVDIPAQTEIAPGDLVTFIPFDR
ncbi:gephyrin-like molybdotransferase Glp [Orrella sp. 11846]|uniref:molybdopterin molybdotransferase MoeA n=1 Tax=Orrella sp. 11846 TaxID=3409913 RepID=UPI003B59B7D1